MLIYNQLRPFSTVVENSTQNPKIEGLKPAAVTRSEKIGKKVKWEFIRQSKQQKITIPSLRYFYFTLKGCQVKTYFSQLTTYNILNTAKTCSAIY